MYTCSLQRMTDKITTFSQFGDAGHGGITRYTLSPEDVLARNEFIKRMEAIGATIKNKHGKDKINMVSGNKAREGIQSGRWPCGCCGREVGSNSVSCMNCNKWCHQRCSGLSHLRRVQNFVCPRCVGGRRREWMVMMMLRMPD